MLLVVRLRVTERFCAGERERRPDGSFTEETSQPVDQP
jgi:hypothetical protein